MTKAEFGNYYQTFSPPDELKTFVKEYWIYDIRGNRVSNGKRELLQPILFPEIIFKSGVDYENFDVKYNKTCLINSSTICGIQSRAKASARVAKEPLFLIGVKLKYPGMHHLLNLPLFELFDKSTSKNDINNNFVNQLEDQLFTLNSSTNIVNTLNTELTNYFYNCTIDNECLQFTSFISSFKNLAQLKEHTQFNYKYLERRFKKYIGITPKKYFKLKRYLSFYKSWLKHDNYSYIDLVYQYDFFDQNHLIKDFKSILNQSPNQFKKTKDAHFQDLITRFYLNLL